MGRLPGGERGSQCVAWHSMRDCACARLVTHEILYTAVFNLAEGIDVEQTEAKLAEYERTNREAIAINAAKKANTRRCAAPCFGV